MLLRLLLHGIIAGICGPALDGASIAPLLNGSPLPPHGTIAAAGSHLPALVISVPLPPAFHVLRPEAAPALHVWIDTRFHHRVALTAAQLANTSHVVVQAIDVMRGSHSLLVELRIGGEVLCNHSVVFDIVPPLLALRAPTVSTARPHARHTTVSGATSEGPLRLAVVDSFGTVQVDGQRQLFVQQCAHLSRETFDVEYLFLSQDRCALPAARFAVRLLSQCVCTVHCLSPALILGACFCCVRADLRALSPGCSWPPCQPTASCR